MKIIRYLFFIASLSRSLKISVARLSLINISKPTAAACGSLKSKKVRFEIVIQKYNEHKKYYEGDQQTTAPFDKFYSKSLQDTLIDKNEYETLCKNFTSMSIWMERKVNLCYEQSENNKIVFFIFNKI